MARALYAWRGQMEVTRLQQPRQPVRALERRDEHDDALVPPATALACGLAAALALAKTLGRRLR